MLQISQDDVDAIVHFLQDYLQYMKDDPKSSPLIADHARAMMEKLKETQEEV